MSLMAAHTQPRKWLDSSRAPLGIGRVSPTEPPLVSESSRGSEILAFALEYMVDDFENALVSASSIDPLTFCLLSCEQRRLGSNTLTITSNYRRETFDLGFRNAKLSPRDVVRRLLGR